MTIKRWRPDTHAVVDEAGGFVAWEDYQAMKRQFETECNVSAEHLEKIERLRQENAVARRQFEIECSVSAEHLDKIRRLQERVKRMDGMRVELQSHCAETETKLAETISRLGEIRELCEQWGPDGAAFDLAELLDKINRIAWQESAVEERGPNEVGRREHESSVVGQGVATARSPDAGDAPANSHVGSTHGPGHDRRETAHIHEWLGFSNHAGIWCKCGEYRAPEETAEAGRVPPHRVTGTSLDGPLPVGGHNAEETPTVAERRGR